MRHTTIIFLCLLLLLSANLAPAAAETFIGVFKTLEGGAVIQRDGQRITASQGMEVHPADTIITDRKGYVGLVFADDTRVSMGPNTEISVNDYLFEPLEKQLSFVMYLIRGTVSLISGQIAKLAPESVQLVLPAATIGVRGTHVLLKVD